MCQMGRDFLTLLQSQWHTASSHSACTLYFSPCMNPSPCVSSLLSDLAGVSLVDVMLCCTGRAASAAVWQEHNAGARLW